MSIGFRLDEMRRYYSRVIGQEIFMWALLLISLTSNTMTPVANFSTEDACRERGKLAVSRLNNTHVALKNSYECIQIR